MKRRDWMLIGCLLAAAGLFWLLFSRKSGEDLAYVAAKVDGTEIARWPVDTDKEADVDTEYGHNRIRIQGRTVVMMEADCPDGYCKEQNAIGAEGGSIICLPHHLVIEMVKENGETNTYDGVDAIAR